MNMLRTTALTMALGFSLGGCDSMRTAAYAGGGAAAAGALGAGIGYIASKGNMQTTAIAGAASAVGGAVIGGAYRGRRQKSQGEATGGRISARSVRCREEAILDRQKPANGEAQRRRKPIPDPILHI